MNDQEKCTKRLSELYHRMLNVDGVGLIAKSDGSTLVDRVRALKYTFEELRKNKQCRIKEGKIPHPAGVLKKDIDRIDECLLEADERHHEILRHIEAIETRLGKMEGREFLGVHSIEKIEERVARLERCFDQHEDEMSQIWKKVRKTQVLAYF